MKWIKYQYVCGTDANGYAILANKRVGYNDANLVVAKAEAYQGSYTIEDDGKEYQTESTFPGNVNMAGNKIKNLGNASDNTDAISLGEVRGIVNESISSKTQLMPEFVNSIEECVDTNKVYVLPDGYIYAYMARSSGGGDYVNQLPIAIDASGAIYNGKGYKEKTRLSTSSGSFEERTEAGWCTSGFIPIARGDVIRLKNCKCTVSTTAATHRGMFNYANSQFAFIGSTSMKDIAANSSGRWNTVLADDGDNIIQFTVPSNFDSNIAYMRLVVQEFTSESIVTVNQEITDPVTTYEWCNTGRAFVPADYEDRIRSLETQTAGYNSRISENSEQIQRNTNNVSGHESRLTAVESALNNKADGVLVPDYWLEHINERVDNIREVMESVGRNKSSFLWYHDAHWNYNYQMSPVLLKYLYEQAPINKTFFGGDIVHNEPTTLSDRETMEYLWDWRNAIRDLPNHHSVVGNHDDGNTTNKLFPDSYIYAYLMAAEECPQIVRGGDFYYYMDDACEKTRYLFLDTAYKCYWADDAEQTAFVKEALKSTPAGWHIVAISHVWVQMDYSVSPAVPGDFSEPAKTFLNIFDAYNARTGEYSSCVGKVEFCIGGHTHIDLDRMTTGGIPVVITETDSRNVRSGLACNAGTITENSVNAIIADYSTNTINVIRIGRGQSRVVTY